MPKKSKKPASKLFWVAIPHKTAWPVKDDNGNVVIPKGSTGVEMAPHQSSKVWTRNSDGKQVHQHVYKWQGKTFNA